MFDTANRFENDSHYQLTVLAPQSAEFSYENGDPAPAGQIPFPPGLLLTLRAVVQSAADLSGYAPQQMTLTGENLDLSGVQIEPRDGEPHVLDLTFTAKATDGTEAPRSITLAIDAFTTEYVLQEGDTPVQEGGINQLYAFPSPMRDQTRFVFDSGTVAGGRIQIFTVAGTHVVDLPVSPGDFSSEGAVVPWDGRDERGDELANGVYLYRVELDGPNGKVTSDGMQRLVVMR